MATKNGCFEKWKILYFLQVKWRGGGKQAQYVTKPLDFSENVTKLLNFTQTVQKIIFNCINFKM